MPVKIALLIGTVRDERVSERVARYVAAQAALIQDIAVRVVDPRELVLPNEGEVVKDQKYSEVTAWADAFVIVTPEYNHSYPGSLKRMLDSEYANYYRKPVALVGVSSGSWGGVRACEALLPVCHRLGLINIHSELYFPQAQDIVDSNGEVAEHFAERYSQNTAKLFEELQWFASRLQA